MRTKNQLIELMFKADSFENFVRSISFEEVCFSSSFLQEMLTDADMDAESKKIFEEVVTCLETHKRDFLDSN
jgi:hypothetical protein